MTSFRLTLLLDTEHSLDEVAAYDRMGRKGEERSRAAMFDDIFLFDRGLKEGML